MIALLANDTKQFMSQLLKGPAFDDFYLVSLDLDLRFRLSIQGAVSTVSALSTESEGGSPYITWSEVKTLITEQLRGKQTPSGIKIIFALEPALIDERLAPGQEHAQLISGFTLTITYLNQQVRLITGTNYATFTLDKSYEQHFDHYIQTFLNQHHIVSTQF